MDDSQRQPDVCGDHLRIYLPLAMVVGLPFEAAYSVVAWLCWVPNLLVASFLVRDRAPVASTAGQTGAEPITATRAAA
jgi:hypothetical protein